MATRAQATKMLLQSAHIASEFYKYPNNKKYPDSKIMQMQKGGSNSDYFWLAYDAEKTLQCRGI
jgi:hypothetical protein